MFRHVVQGEDNPSKLRLLLLRHFKAKGISEAFKFYGRCMKKFQVISGWSREDNIETKLSVKWGRNPDLEGV